MYSLSGVCLTRKRTGTLIQLLAFRLKLILGLQIEAASFWLYVFV